MKFRWNLFRAGWCAWHKRHGRANHRPQNRRGELGLTDIYRKPSGNAHDRRKHWRKACRERHVLCPIKLDNGSLQLEGWRPVMPHTVGDIIYINGGTVRVTGHYTSEDGQLRTLVK